MNESHEQPRDYLDAVLKTAQYLSLLRSDEDIWQQLERVVTRFFQADVVAFYEPSSGGELLSCSCSLPTAAERDRLAQEVCAATCQVLDTGFLASELVSLPETFAVALLPLTRGDGADAAFLIGHRADQPYSQTELNVYLAVAGLLGSTLSRLAEQRSAREQLQAASLYARSLIEASLDPLVTISAEGKITDVNAATEQVTGAGREQLIGTDFSDYFTEPDEARRGYQKVFAEGSVVDYPLAIRHVSGDVADVLYTPRSTGTRPARWPACLPLRETSLSARGRRSSWRVSRPSWSRPPMPS